MISNNWRNLFPAFLVSLLFCSLFWADISEAISAGASSPANIDKSYRGSDPYRDFPKHSNFPTPWDLRSKVEFWKKIYSKYSTRNIVIHDRDHLNVIYEVVDLNKSHRKHKASSRKVRRYKKNRKRHIVAILKKLYRNRGKATTAEEKAIAGKFAHIPGYKKFKSAARRVRAQLGQADRFKAGLKRSGKYIREMRKIFRSHGLPEELTVLPHVESSFNYKAYSSAGAAGIWQFTRGTGRLFMKLNYTVDERRDPIVATDSAARLLKSNFRALRSWPLAITAYNHGTNGMKRAKRKYGDNIGKIIKNYRSRSFGFASKNFYAEFLAALEVTRNYKRYFGRINFEPKFRYDMQLVRNYIPARTLAKKMGLPLDTLRGYNPALRKSVWSGRRHVPKGYKLRVPAGLGDIARTAIASIPRSSRFSTQKMSKWHIVRRGDALSLIAKRYRVSLRSLKSANNLSSNTIFKGQKLVIPGRANKRVAKRKTATVVVYKKPDSGEHYVMPGESLFVISERYGMNMYKLARINGMRIRDKIHPGQILKLKKPAPAPKVASIAPVVAVKAHTPAKVKTGTAASMETELVKITTEPAKNDNRGFQLKRSDYAIKMISDNTGKVVVRPEETIGHYAEWSRVPVKRVLSLNRKKRMRHIRSGSPIKVPLSRVSAEQFEQKRLEYHMSLREDFYDAYKVDGEKEVSIKRGQSLWDLCVKENEAPIWLVRLYNPDARLNNLMPGDIITIPTVVKK